MSWLNNQIKQRKQLDDQNLQEAFAGIAGAILGKRLKASLVSNELVDAAISKILDYYGYEIKKNDLPKEITDPEAQINYRIKPFGIFRREVILKGDWYNNAIGAFLGTYKDKEDVVAFIPGKFGGYYYYDFSTNKLIRITKKNRDLFSSEATCFYKPLPLKKLSMIDLLKYVASLLSTYDIAIYIMMMAIMTLLGMVSPYITKWLFSDVVESGSIRVLISLAIFMICYTVAQLLVQAFTSLINTRISTKQNIVVNAAVMQRIVSLPATFFKDFSSGELSQRSSYVQSLCSSLTNTIMSTGLTSIFSLVYINQVFVFAPGLVVPSICITLATIVLSIITTIVNTKVSQEKMMLSAKESGLSYSIITGIQKIKIAGAENRVFAKWAKLYSNSLALITNPPRIVKFSGVYSQIITCIGTLVLYYCAVKTKVSVADYYAFNSAYSMISGAFASLAGIFTSVSSIKPILEMARPILETEPEISENKQVVTSISGNIELSHVSFRYTDTMPLVIDDLSLKINEGEYIAIVGSTGCGKSTLLRLLLGFEKPQKGSIYYDQKDINNLDAQSLRRCIGVVMQNGKLFNDSIYSNIVITAPETTMDEAWQAAEIASIADDIREMPMGMHTMISEGSGGISGGQKQRLMIARAIASKPKVLMFDEATSALDNITQKKVSEAIDSLHCTRIVIAHRLSTIKHCDRIVVLDKGKIIEDGTYEELIKHNGFFAELVERQRIDN